jgi:hypothetical protein
VEGLGRLVEVTSTAEAFSLQLDPNGRRNVAGPVTILKGSMMDEQWGEGLGGLVMWSRGGARNEAVGSWAANQADNQLRQWWWGGGRGGGNEGICRTAVVGG